MADFDAGTHTTDDGLDCPYVEFGGERRLLTALPTPRDHVMLAACPTWEQTGYPTLTEQQVRDLVKSLGTPGPNGMTILDLSQGVVPTLDQNGRGACLPHAWAKAVMQARARAGWPFVKLSPWFLYSNINNGVDAGSNAGDAAQALTTKGICPDEMVPYATIHLRAISAAAVAAAKDYQIEPPVQLKDYLQVATAIIMGAACPFDVCAGPFFKPDGNGVVGWTPGPNNHEVLACSRVAVTAKGEIYVGLDNSWGDSWGDNGHAWATARLIDGSQETNAVFAARPAPHDFDGTPLMGTRNVWA